MNKLLLIFFGTIIILFVGLVFGIDQNAKPKPIPEEIVMLSEPFSDNIDIEFLRETAPGVFN